MEKKNHYKINPETINQDFFNKVNNAKLLLKRKSVRGAIIGLSGLSIFASGIAVGSRNVERNQQNVVSEVEVNEISNEKNDDVFSKFDVGIEPSLLKNPLAISLEDVNSLNIIINNNKSSNSFFNNVCEGLQDDGVVFSTTSDCQNVDVPGSVVITLDQLYLSSPEMVFFAPFDNSRKGDSDALALSMETSFKNNNFSTDGVFCGKVGYRKSPLGEFISRVPTSTEEAIDSKTNCSFVTVSFGTTFPDTEKVVDSIEEGLARFVYYQNEKGYGEDLIYRVQGGDIMPTIQEKFNNATVEDINSYNNLNDKSNYVYMDNTLINPQVAKMGFSNANKNISLNLEKANFYN